MSNPDDRLGGRLPLLHRADLAPEQQTLWDQVDATMAAWAGKIGFESKTADNRLIGPFDPVLRSPGLAQTPFGERGLVDFAVPAGCYYLVCGLLNLFAIPAPNPA